MWEFIGTNANDRTLLMRTITVFVIPLILCLGCYTRSAEPGNLELREKLRAITLSDGVSQSEAEIIGQSYFAKNVGCGVFTGIRDGGDRWIVDAKFGYAGEPVRDFFIDK